MKVEEILLLSVKLMLQRFEEQNEGLAALLLTLQKKGALTREEFLASLHEIQRGPDAVAARASIEKIGGLTLEDALEILKHYQGPVQ